ncbi:MAG: hypothetical protein JSS15_09365 [Proteobacteria bacterium]|nr:hypothetical protein [Pseudomonadota bacterium]
MKKPESEAEWVALWQQFNRSHAALAAMFADAPSRDQLLRWNKGNYSVRGRGQPPLVTNAEIIEALVFLRRRHCPTTIEAVRMALTSARGKSLTITDRTLRRTLYRVGLALRRITSDHPTQDGDAEIVAAFRKGLLEYINIIPGIPPVVWSLHCTVDPTTGQLRHRLPACILLAADETTSLKFHCDMYEKEGTDTVKAHKSKQACTIIPFVSANGELVHVAIIFAGSTVGCAPTWLPDGISIHFTPTGWMTTEVMAECLTHLSKVMATRRRLIGVPDSIPTVLLMDCHSTHTGVHYVATDETVTLAERTLAIKIWYTSPGLSHELNVGDLVLNCDLKRVLKSAITRLHFRCVHHGADGRLRAFPIRIWRNAVVAAVVAWAQHLQASTVRAGFRTVLGLELGDVVGPWAAGTPASAHAAERHESVLQEMDAVVERFKATLARIAARDAARVPKEVAQAAHVIATMEGIATPEQVRDGVRKSAKFHGVVGDDAVTRFVEAAYAHAAAAAAARPPVDAPPPPHRVPLKPYPNGPHTLAPAGVFDPRDRGSIPLLQELGKFTDPTFLAKLAEAAAQRKDGDGGDSEADSGGAGTDTEPAAGDVVAEGAPPAAAAAEGGAVAAAPPVVPGMPMCKRVPRPMAMAAAAAKPKKPRAKRQGANPGRAARAAKNPRAQPDEGLAERRVKRHCSEVRTLGTRCSASLLVDAGIIAAMRPVGAQAADAAGGQAPDPAAAAAAAVDAAAALGIGHSGMLGQGDAASGRGRGRGGRGGGRGRGRGGAGGRTGPTELAVAADGAQAPDAAAAAADDDDGLAAMQGSGNGGRGRGRGRGRGGRGSWTGGRTAPAGQLPPAAQPPPAQLPPAAQPQPAQLPPAAQPAETQPPAAQQPAAVRPAPSPEELAATALAVARERVKRSRGGRKAAPAV